MLTGKRFAMWSSINDVKPLEQDGQGFCDDGKS